MGLFSRLSAGYKRLVSGAESFETPDVTRVQQIALGQAIVAVLAVFGFDLDADTTTLVLALAGAIGVALPVSDAAIRRARAASAPEIQQARAAQPAGEASPADLAARRRLIELRGRLARLQR
jgi:hypothetical protein